MKVMVRTIRTAVNAIRRNVMRSSLTTLGIVIGVAAVIAMMEIGNGSSALMQETLTKMGTNLLQVRPGSLATTGINWGSGTALTLSAQDADAIMRECPAVSAAAPIVNANGQAVYGSRNRPMGSITGTTPAFLEIRNWTDLAEGTAFTEQDVRNVSKVCLIGQTAANDLFDGESPIGKEIRVANVSLRIVGLLSKKGANTWGQDQDDVIIAPWTTIKYRISGTGRAAAAAATSGGVSTSVNSLSNLYPSSSVQLYPLPSQSQAANTPQPIRFANVNQILAAARSAEDIQPAIKQITSVLRDTHRLREGVPDDFWIQDMTEMGKVLSSSTSLMTTLLLCVALISLIVGGVGIMNIMLVSVTERTREIGLRMAVGARGRDILRQFLIEAMVLCLIGGALGILLGRGGSLIVRATLNWPTQISWPAIIIAVAVSGGVGIAFGFYPAWKASRLNPIEALRYE